MKILKSISYAMLITSMTIAFNCSALATTPYRAYFYDYWADPVEMPNPYLPYMEYDTDSFGESGLNSPNDMVYDGEDNIYIADTGNNRIVKLNKNFEMVSEIVEFNNGDGFNKPMGVFADDDKIYVCDNLNNRVVILSKNGEYINEIKNIENSILPSDFIFLPEKVVVDKAGRIYVLAKNVFEGLMAFDKDGEFTGYFGTISVQFNPIDMFWRTIATDEQKAKMIMFIPTEFTSLDIDEKGFIYTTEMSTGSDSKVKKINPSGKNVLTNYTSNPIVGDLLLRGNDPSYFVDIDINNSGVYTALDRTNGRIFTYDNEGNNLYTYGTIGNEFGNFNKPIAIENIDNKVAVLDSQLNRVIVFEPTYYGDLINQATDLRYNGSESEAVEVWEDVLEFNANYEIASKGIGKAYLSSGDNVNAMKYLKQGYDRKNYSVAFKRYRNQLLKDNAYVILGVVFGLIFVNYSLKLYKKKSKKKGEI